MMLSINRLAGAAAVAMLSSLLWTGAPAAAASDRGDLRNEARAAAGSISKRSLTDAGVRVAAAADRRRAVTAAARVVCYQVHVQNIGWQDVRCNGETAGTTGQGLQMEAIAIAV